MSSLKIRFYMKRQNVLCESQFLSLTVTQGMIVNLVPDRNLYDIIHDQ